MELGHWVCVQIIANLDNRGSDDRGSTVFVFNLNYLPLLSSADEFQ